MFGVTKLDNIRNERIGGSKGKRTWGIIFVKFISNSCGNWLSLGSVIHITVFCDIFVVYWDDTGNVWRSSVDANDWWSSRNCHYIYYIHCHTYPACKKQCSVNTNNIDSSGYVVLSVDSHLRNRKSPFHNVLTADTPPDQPGSPIVLPMVGLRMNKLNERCSKVFNLTVAWETI